MGDIAAWKSALLTLDDVPFFDLIRGYLGDIRTPFNKQRLVDELAGFLGRRENLQTLTAYLDATDRKLIAAISSLNEPTAAELTSFFDGELSFAELHGILLNLEERLIVYRFQDASARRLAVNPILSPALEPFERDASILYPASAAQGETDLPRSRAALDDVALAAAAAFVERRADLFKADGSFRKKAAEEAASIFPADDFERAVRTLRGLGALRLSAAGVVVDGARLRSLAEASPFDRRAYCAAALCASELSPAHDLFGESGNDADEDEAAETGARRAGSPSFGRVPRERLSSWARLFVSFLDALDPALSYPPTTLARIMDTRERAAAAPRKRRWEARDADPAAGLRDGTDPSAFRRAAVDSLVAVGLLERADDGACRRTLLNPAAPVPVENAANPVIVLDAAFSVVAYPEIGFIDALSLGAFLDVREAGRAVRYELTRDSAVRGFDRGISVDKMLGLLESLARRPVAQNVRWSLKEWFERYSSVCVYHGTVLVVAPDRRYLMQASPIAELVRRELAPGVYLLSARDETEAAKALSKAGVDIVAIPSDGPSGAEATELRLPVFPAITRHRAENPLAASLAAVRAASPAGGAAGGAAEESGESKKAVDAKLAELRALLEAKRLPKDQRDELAARIDRRVVLSARQLVGAAVRYEKLEAKGLDYVGKVRVAEQAIAAGALVELFWRGPKGEPVRALGSPLALDKSGGEVELIVDPAPRGEALRVPIGKISLLRRIKRSMFGE